MADIEEALSPYLPCVSDLQHNHDTAYVLSGADVSNSLRPQAPLLDSPGRNTAVGFHFSQQGIFLAQGSNPHLLHCQAGVLTTRTLGKPMTYHAKDHNQSVCSVVLTKKREDKVWRMTNPFGDL